MSRSLRVRLALVSVVSIATALTVAGFLLMHLFERHVLRRVDQELSAYTKQLAAMLTLNDKGKVELGTNPADPRFDRPFSGLYWQLESPGGNVLRSRSLWDQSLSIPDTGSPGAIARRLELAGPDNKPLIALVRQVYVETGQGDLAIRLVAAIAKDEVDTARVAFLRDLVLALGLLGTVLLSASWVQIVIGLRPLNELRDRVNAIRTGVATMLEGEHPAEVNGLVREMNALLEARASSIARARGSAADLAHGLKTPLAILQAESRTLRAGQQIRQADEIDAQVEQMRQQVERHLVIARLRGPGGSAVGATAVRPALAKIVRAMTAMPHGEDIDWQLEVPESFSVAMDDHDFLEVFGNLLDNARKWAQSRVRIQGDETRNAHLLVISDDGPGVPPDEMEAMQERGIRLDEKTPGSGLGLGIARDALDACGATLDLACADGSGLTVTVRIPKLNGD